MIDVHVAYWPVIHTRVLNPCQDQPKTVSPNIGLERTFASYLAYMRGPVGSRK